MVSTPTARRRTRAGKDGDKDRSFTVLQRYKRKKSFDVLTAVALTAVGLMLSSCLGPNSLTPNGWAGKQPS